MLGRHHSAGLYSRSIRKPGHLAESTATQAKHWSLVRPQSQHLDTLMYQQAAQAASGPVPKHPEPVKGIPEQHGPTQLKAHQSVHHILRQAADPSVQHGMELPPLLNQGRLVSI